MSANASRLLSGQITRLCLRALAAYACITLFATPRNAHAQAAGRGFLFAEPRGAVTFTLGFASPNAQSEIFDFTRDLLTVEKGDFNSLTLGVEYAHHLSPRVDLLGSAGWAGNSRRSEFRDWVDQDDQPIEQTTTFSRMPFTAGVRLYPISRGRGVGEFAWIPATYSPYVGVGGGVMWYRFVQSGDFVDFQDNEIFTETLRSSGWSATAYASAGLDISLSPRLALATEGRYSWAKATMQDDFSGFDNIDLSGLTVTAGLRIRF